MIIGQEENNVVDMFPASTTLKGLQQIIAAIEIGRIDPDIDCTLVIGADVFHLGCIDTKQAQERAAFNLMLGQQILMRPIIDSIED